MLRLNGSVPVRLQKPFRRIATSSNTRPVRGLYLLTSSSLLLKLRQRGVRLRRILVTPEFESTMENSTELKAKSFSGKVLADYDEFLQYSRRVSFGKTSRDTAVSNLPRSGSQSRVLDHSPINAPRKDSRCLFRMIAKR
jgi:hypothetical protein